MSMDKSEFQNELGVGEQEDNMTPISSVYNVVDEVKIVIFQIKWDVAHWHYTMDMGSHGYELEMLLYDGQLLYVYEVTDEEDPNGVQFTLIKLECFKKHPTPV